MKLEINKMEIDGNEANGIASNWSDEFLREIKNEDDSKQNEDSEGFTDVHPSYIPLCPIKNEGERCFVKKDTKSSDNRDDDDDGSADCGGSADDDNNGGDDERKDGDDAYGGSTDCGSSDDDNCNRNRDYRSRNLSVGVTSKDEEKTERRKCIKCTICGRTFKNKKFMNRHVRYVHYQHGSVSCRKCRRIYINHHTFERHRKICKKLSPEQVAEFVSFAKYVCSTCNIKFSTCESFLQHQRNTHQWKNIKTEPSKQDEIKHSKNGNVLETSTPERCDECEKVFHNKSLLLEHIRRQHDTPYERGKVPKCGKCKRKFVNHANLQRHRCKERAIHIGLPKSKVLSHRGIPFSGGNEGDTKKDDSIDNDIHTASAYTKLYHCKKCNRGYTQIKLLKNHMRRNCPKDRFFECAECSLQFETKVELSNHKITEGCGSLFKCSICEAILATSQGLSVHIKKHSTPAKKCKFECPQCDLQFYSLNRLEFHIQLHKTKQCPFFKCKLCDETFTTRTKILDHRKTVHIDGKSYTSKLLCEVCGKWFSTTITLEVHMNSHRSNRPYVCTICGHKSTTDPALRKHMNIHTGRKPYQCDVCGKNFSRKENMKTHYTVHTGELKYQCNICGKKCSRSDNLATHLKMHARKKIVASQRN